MNRKERRAAAALGGRGGNAIPAEAYDSYVRGYNSHTSGDMEGAKAHYLRAAKQAPHHAGVLLGLGLIALKDGLLDDAERLLRRAASSEPRDANILANLSAALLQNRKFGDCLETCQKALELQPQNVEALINLCHAQRELGNIDAAIDVGKRSIEAGPQHGLAYRAYALSLMLKPENIAERFDEITQYVAKAREFAEGTDVQLDLTLADLLLERGQFREVVDIVERTDPAVVSATLYRIGDMANFGLQRYDVALEFAKKRCDLEPDSSKAHARMATVLSNLYRYDDALACLERAINLDPTEYKAKLDICQIRQLVCNWDGLEELQQAVVQDMRENQTFTGPFHLISMPEPAGSPENQLLAARLYSERVGMTRAIKQGRHERTRTNKRLKIGYLSNDYRDHATAYLISELIELHDRRNFEISAYCYSHQNGSPFQRRLRSAFDNFVDVNPLSIEETAKRINDDQIDILVDLKGFTQGSRSNVLALRSAPIQVNYLGFPGTLGADFVDYIIGDEFLTPFASAAYYAEKIVQLPNCYQPNDTKRPLPHYKMRREQFGLPEDSFVFASFNNPNKLSPEVFRIWARLLRDVPNSVLWMYAPMPSIQTNLRKEAQAHGIDPQRLIFAEFAEVSEHISRLRLADLFLDCFPCTAHTTASEAVWAGLPLITCAGRTFASRVAGSILHAANLPELVTTSLEDYEALALELARNPARLSALRARVEMSAGTPLFDIASYTRDLERAYLHMADVYNSNRQAEAFAVRDLEPLVSNLPPIVREPARMTAASALSLVDDHTTDASSEARVNYGSCPVCFDDNFAKIGSSDCSGHPLYKSNLPASIDWQICQDCKHVFASGFFGEEALQSLYETTPVAERVGHDLERKRHSAAKIVQRVARIAKGGTWLDVGFGDASLLFTAEEWGYPVVGLDVRGDNVAALNKLGYEAHEACIELYEPSEKCSVISMVNLLQHLPFPSSAIEHAARLLKPGGVLFLTMPNMDTALWRSLDQTRQNPYWGDLEIYHHFTRKNLYRLLVMNGLLPLEYGINEEHRTSMDVIALRPAD